MSLTERWVRVYTAGVPEPARSRRRDEIACDVHDQLSDAASRRRARVAVAGRTVRGAVDDLVWRRETRQGMTRTTSMRAALTQAWWAPFAALVLLFDIGLAVGVLADEGSTMPGRVVGPAVVLVAATCLAIGLWVRVGGAAARGGGSRQGRYAAVALVAMIALSATVGGPAPLVLTALTVVVAAAVLGLDRVRTAGGADALILLGTLPAVAMFWLIVPGLLAVAVIVGVLTGRPRASVAPA